MPKRLLSIAAICACTLLAGRSEAANPEVVMETTFGDFVIELFVADAPETVSNFMLYVKDGFYNGTIFHRVDEDFVIQGGFLDTNYLPRETRARIQNESANGLSNIRGTLAMARTSDPHSASSQFFINQVDNLFLDREQARDGWGYCVFGNLVAGHEVLDLIASQPTGFLPKDESRPYDLDDVPMTPIVIQTAYAVEGPETELQKVYISYYGRPGDPAGVGWWAGELEAAGGSLDAIIDAYGTSPEFNVRYGDLDNGQLVDTIYQQMFGRAPDAEGRAFYVDSLDRRERSLQRITLDILNGALNDDARIIANKLLIAGYFTDEVAARGLSYGDEDINAARDVLSRVGASPTTIATAMGAADAVLAGME